MVGSRVSHEEEEKSSEEKKFKRRSPSERSKNDVDVLLIYLLARGPSPSIGMLRGHSNARKREIL